MAIQSFRCHDNFFHLCLDKGDIILKEQEKSIIRSEYSELVKNKVFVYWPKALITGICSSFVGIATLIVVTIAYTDDWKWEYINGKPVNGKDEY